MRTLWSVSEANTTAAAERRTAATRARDRVVAIIAAAGSRRMEDEAVRRSFRPFGLFWVKMEGESVTESERMIKQRSGYG